MLFNFYLNFHVSWRSNAFTIHRNEWGPRLFLNYLCYLIGGRQTFRVYIIVLLLNIECTRVKWLPVERFYHSRPFSSLGRGSNVSKEEGLGYVRDSYFLPQDGEIRLWISKWSLFPWWVRLLPPILDNVKKYLSLWITCAQYLFARLNSAIKLMRRIKRNVPRNLVLLWFSC
jgi:hypothetical protein